MSNPAIPRADVHRFSEECSDAGDDYRGVATRLIRDQKPLANFIQANMPHMKGEAGEVSMYMFSVILRIFERAGGRLKKVPQRAAVEAAGRLRPTIATLMPFDEGLPERLRAVEGVSQPHILGECIWALYEREEKQEGEIDVPADQAGLILVLLWAAVEALNASWRPPSGYAEYAAGVEAAEAAEPSEA
ncbi:MAG: hypothetical protein H6741_00595 [Alphaproteobacteria bacterium]|nr:hypothetical protein [Alphaproteobacteria bacterium]MCB9791203.1 hypothetical protein [Alphaproteobacteria bacterium]